MGFGSSGGGGWRDWQSRARRVAQNRASSRSSNRSSSRRGPPAQPSYDAATSAGRSTVSSGLSNVPGINQTPADIYWGSDLVTPLGQGTRGGYEGFRAAYRDFAGAGTGLSTPSYGGSGGGGYGRGGGGGGGGGAPAMTQAMFDQMLAVLGTNGPGLTLQQAQLPAFRGTNLPAFNSAPYTQATNQLTAAVNADKAATQAGTTRATQALQANYTNPYATAQVQAAPPAQQVGGALQATAGGGGDAAYQAAQANAAAASDQASFANLLNVLGAADQAAQTSRLNQVQLDQNTALQNIGAQSRGLLGGIQMARTQGANQWAQADAERRYQNSLMAQQWQREGMMRNQDIANQQAQGNWQQRNEMINNRLTPLLQLIQGTAGTKINMDALTKILQGWGR